MKPILLLLALLCLTPIPSQAADHNPTVDETELRIVRQHFEEMIVWDERGRVMYDVRGVLASLELRMPYWETAYVDIATHNHVCDGDVNDQTFSYGDYVVATQFPEAREFRVVSACPNFTLHRFIRTGAFWPDVTEAQWQRSIGLAGNDYDAAWALVAARNGFGYD